MKQETFGVQAERESDWWDAARTAEMQGSEFSVFNHPLLPGWRLHVNDKVRYEEREYKPDQAPAAQTHIRPKHLQQRRRRA